MLSLLKFGPESVTEKNKKKTGANKSTEKSSGSPDHFPRGQHKTGVSARFVTDFGKKMNEPRVTERERACEVSI